MFNNLIGPTSPVGPDSNAIIEAVRVASIFCLEESDPDEAQLTSPGSLSLKMLRFGPDTDQIVIYVTLGCSAEVMQDPSTMVVDTGSGPCAELVLPIRGGLDGIIRPLSIPAASPSIGGLVLTEDAFIGFGQPLWDQSHSTSFVLLRTEIPSVTVGETEVTIFQSVPATTNEFTLVHAKGIGELCQVWETQGVDFINPHRTSTV